jgi:mannose-6-phosphate isomerase-like protein (cupin superfamily)
MSYPEPRYHGDSGEVSGVLRTESQGPELVYPSGVKVRYLATDASTGGEFGLYRWDMGAERGGPDPHFHKTFSESFFVLDGTVSLFDGIRWVDGSPGDFLFVPEGGIHGFRNESGPASMLLLFTPGAPREGYFETLAEVAAGREMTGEEKAEFFHRHDTYWV